MVPANMGIVVGAEAYDGAGYRGLYMEPWGIVIFKGVTMPLFQIKSQNMVETSTEKMEPILPAKSVLTGPGCCGHDPDKSK